MELLKDTPFEVAWLVWKAKPTTPCLTVVVKATFTVVESGPCPIAPAQVLPTGDLHHDDDVERSVRYESDFAYIKPQGECYITGSCHAPGGAPVKATLAAFKIGPVSKKMAIIGDRHFKGLLGGQTEPVPFTAMPLCWERSFGGKKSKDNPVGLGMGGKVIVAGKAVVPLPNIEDQEDLIHSRKQQPRPMGAFPIPRTWPARARLAGTYDARWKRSRWPWPADDLQWAYFNAAPEDQRIKGFFRGTEEITLLNLHPSIEKVRCRLPGLRPRAFLKDAAGPGFKSLKPDLDTIVVDADAGQVLCVWRAVVEVPSESLDDYSHLFVLHEPVDQDAAIADYRARFEQRLAEESDAAFEPEPVPAATVAPEGYEDVAARLFAPLGAPAAVPPPARPTPPVRPAWAGGEPSYLGAVPSMVALPRASALPVPLPIDSPVLIAGLSPEELEHLQRDAEVEGEATELMDPAQLLAAMDEEAAGAADAAEIAALLAQVEAELAAEAETPATGEATELVDAAALSALLASGRTPLPAPVPPEVEPARDSLEEGSTMFFMQHLASLVDLPPDVPGPGPRPAPAAPPRAGVVARGAAGRDPDEAPPAWAGDLRRALDEAGEPAPARPEPAPESEAEAARRAQRARVEAAIASREGCAGWDLADADLSGLDLSGLDLSHAVLTRARLAATKLDGAKLDGATLLEAELVGASLRGASMRSADLTRVRGHGLRLEEVQLEDATAVEADLRQAVLVGCACARAELGGADLTGARLERTVLDGADLSAAKLDGAVAVGSSLVDAEVGAMSARQADLEGCDLRRLRADDGADLTEANLRAATIDKGHFARSTLTRANLSLAALDRADFSDADLTGATLLGCKARDARFDRARLVNAGLGRADLHQARFEGADLRFADLRGANLFSAELLDANVQDAKLELANLKGTKLA